MATGPGRRGNLYTGGPLCHLPFARSGYFFVRVLKLLTAVFGVSGLFASSACIDVNYQTTAFRCNPRSGDDSCPTGYQCCSDDPSIVSGVAVFSGDNNQFSASGMCVDETAMAGLPNGCPIPCNPNWSTDMKTAVCGPASQALCCQTAALEPEDCIFDPGRGDAGCFRPVTGNDTPMVECPIADLQARLATVGLDQGLARCNTDWSKSAHITHQDPGVAAADSACHSFEAVAGVSFNECVQSLGVADTRGFCLAKSPDVMVCPTDLTNEEKIANGIPLDACTNLNNTLNYTGCL
jgi:hypothetical protein